MAAIIPEFVLQTILVRGIGALKRDRRLVDQLFKNFRASDVDEIYKFISTKEIDIAINYPKQPVVLPGIVILLKGESEVQAYVGDTMAFEQPDEFSFDGGVSGQLLGGVASVSSLSGEGKVAAGPMIADGGTSTTITTVTTLFPADMFVGKNYTLRLVGGKGQGQIRNITANVDGEFTVNPAWSVVPDNTTIFEVRTTSEEVFGEPSKLYDRRSDTPFIEKRGSIYGTTLQFQIGAPNQTLTLCLYYIVKSILTIFRTKLEEQGIINMKMSGTDFIARPDYFPDLAYVRALNVEFMQPFDVYEDVDPLIDELNIVIEALPPLVVAPIENE